MRAQSLVLCHDPELLRVFCPALFRLHMEVNICPGPEIASQALHRQPFASVIAECDREGGGFQLFEQLRSDPLDREPVKIGIVENLTQTRKAFDLGINFVLSKPVTQEQATRILRYVRCATERPYRRFPRITARYLARVHLEGSPEPAFTLDLSEHGMGLQFLTPVHPGATFSLSFVLPGTRFPIVAKGIIAWSELLGQAGLKFTQMSDDDRAQLRQWLLDRGLGRFTANRTRYLAAGPPPVSGDPPKA